MTKIPYTFSGNTLSAFVKNKLYTIPKSQPNYERLTTYLENTDDHNEEHTLELLDVKTMISRLTAGRVTVVGNEVFYKGMPIRSALTQKLMEMLEAGEDATPWANFLNNLMKNPSERSKECAFNFVDNHAAPLTPDGCFVAWKYVRDDFTSAHANPDGSRVDNSPGLTVTMDRKLVNPDPNVTCSTGLHVCASPYLGGYSSNAKIVKVKVNPRDICAVPTDYAFQKMRVCRYYVMEEVLNEAEIARVDAQRVTEDSSAQTAVDALPEQLVGLPVCTTGAEFAWSYTRTDDEVMPEMLVARQGGILVGYVEDVSEDQEDPDGYFDDDGDWCEEDVGEYFWIHRIIWQTGFIEDVVLYDGEMGQLTAVKPVKPKTDEEVFAEADQLESDLIGLGNSDIDTSDIPEQGEEFFAKAKKKKHKPKAKKSKAKIFTHKKSGTEIAAKALVKMVQKKGQREVSRLLNVPRSTIQGWLASL